jgi:hypothetical protein
MLDGLQDRSGSEANLPTDKVKIQLGVHQSAVQIENNRFYGHSLKPNVENQGV